MHCVSHRHYKYLILTIPSMSVSKTVWQFSVALVCLFSNKTEIIHLKIYLALQF